MGERRRDGEDCKNLTEYIIAFYVSPVLLCMAAAQPVTSHSYSKLFYLFFSFFPCLAKRMRR